LAAVAVVFIVSLISLPHVNFSKIERKTKRGRRG